MAASGAASDGPDHLIPGGRLWARIAPPIIGRPDQHGSTGRDDRTFVEVVLRTDAPRRDRPAVFGAWNDVFGRAARSSSEGVRWRISASMADDPDLAYRLVASIIVRAHLRITRSNTMRVSRECPPAIPTVAVDA